MLQVRTERGTLIEKSTLLWIERGWGGAEFTRLRSQPHALISWWDMNFCGSLCCRVVSPSRSYVLQAVDDLEATEWMECIQVRNKEIAWFGFVACISQAVPVAPVSQQDETAQHCTLNSCLYGGRHTSLAWSGAPST